jgi:nicotinate-nucleotide adenylyltransferase
VRLGIFGGSFDPPHLGHLLPLIDAAETLGLDQVRLVPAATQPFKVGRASASAEDRFAMTERLVQGVPGFSVSRAEIDRAGLSFTVDTLASFHSEQPEVALTLLLGADAYDLFEQWRDPARIRSLAAIAVMARGDEPVPGGLPPSGVELLRTRRVDISSTELRARVAGGRTIRGFTPDAVADYIAGHRLYR